MTLGSQLESGLQTLSLDIDEAACQRLLDYVALLVKWNRVFNLTAVRDPEQMIGHHLLDSLVLLPWLDSALAEHETHNSPMASGNRLPDSDFACRANSVESTTCDLLDIGSGGGLPVIPLAIVRPDLACLSVESNGKKSRFQQQVALELGLANLTVRQARIEKCADTARIVTSRAFAAPADFLAIAARHVASDGYAIVMLGQAELLPDPVPEPWRLQQMQRLHVPELDAPRHLAICRRRNE